MYKGLKIVTWTIGFKCKIKTVLFKPQISIDIRLCIYLELF